MGLADICLFLFVFKQKWPGAYQKRGVLSKKDILNAAGEDGLVAVLAVIRSEL